MKDQRTNSHNRSALLTLTAVLLMLVISVIGFTAIAAADAQEEVSVDWADFIAGEGTELDDGYFVKSYDGTSDAYLAGNPDAEVEFNGTVLEGIGVEVNSATYYKANGETAINAWEAAYIEVDYKLINKATGEEVYDYAFPAIKIPGKIEAKALVPNWSDAEKPYATATVDFDADGIVLSSAALEGFNGWVGVVAGDTVNVSIIEANHGILKKGDYERVVYATTDDANYVVTPFDVKFTVEPITITSIEWGSVNKWTYGDANPIRPIAKDANGKLHNVLVVTSAKEGYALGNAGNYTLEASVISEYADSCVLGNDAVATYNVTIERKVYTISMSDTTVIGDGKNTYTISVHGNIPENVLNQIVYKRIIDKLTDGDVFTGTKDFGNIDIKAELPVANYKFLDQSGAEVTTLTATLKVLRQEKLFPVYDEAGNEVGSIILTNRNGFSDDVEATVVALKGYPNVVRHTKFSQVYKISVTGAAEGQTFSLVIPLNDSVYAPRAEELSIETLCVYEAATGSLIPANSSDKGYSVVLGQGYYQVDGFTGAGETTFVVAPMYNAPFFQTAWGILLIILLVIAILVMMCYIGLYLRRILETRENPVTVIDTVGELPEHEPVELDEKAEVDVDEVIEQNLDEMAETVEETAEEPVEVDEAELQDAVDESMQTLMDEAAEVELDEETVVPEELAEEVAEEVAETVEAEEPAVEEEVVEAAVAEAVEEAVAEEVVEAAEEVVEEAAEEATEEDDSDDSDNDNDSDGDNDGDEEAVEAVSMVEDDPFGFAAVADASTFVDVKEDPEAYKAMLDREARGEIKIIYRYKKSFQSKLAQSQGNVQDYYSELKNALLTFKGVKNRLSWNYEAFNKGRAHVAKMDAKAKTLYLYLALDPTQFVDTKYGIVDVSAKRKYASTPTLIKIKGERKFKHALELIEKLCGEQMELVKAESENVDYRVARMTIEEMVEAGLMKQSAGYVVLVPTEDAVPADAQVETTPEEN